MTIEWAPSTPLFRSPCEERIEVLGCSDADELADLEIVWANLCQEAAAPRPAGRLPEQPPFAAVRAAGRSLSASRWNRVLPDVVRRHAVPCPPT